MVSFRPASRRDRARKRVPNMTADRSESDDYRVAISGRTADPHDLSEIFQRVLHLHPTDAMIWARHVPGVLTETFTADQARELIAAIEPLGIDVSAIPAADVPDLHHALPVHHARCQDDGLQIVGVDGEPSVLIPWPAVQMVSVGEVPLESAHHYPSGMWSGVSAGHHYQNPDITLALTPSLEAWMTCAPPYPNLRIDHEHMNYEYLGERRVDSATCNFKEFLQDVTTRATGALATESTEAYLRHIEPERFRFSGLDELLHYATLHAALARKPARVKLPVPTVADQQTTTPVSTNMRTRPAGSEAVRQPAPIVATGQPIVVAIDFSHVSPALINHAWNLAASQSSEVHFLHVQPRSSFAHANPQLVSNGALQALQTLASLPGGSTAPPVKFTHLVRIGSPAAEIINYARECSASTILLGTRGRSRLIQMVLGSVAEAVLQDAPCPVLVIPDHCLVETPVAEESTPSTETVTREEPFLQADQAPDLDGNRVVELLRRAVQWRATDIHIDSVGPDRVWIRFRVDGKLRTFCHLDQHLAAPLLMQLRLMADLDTTHTFAPQEARLKLPPVLGMMEVRITIVPASDGDAVAMRLLRHETMPRPLGSLGMSPSTYAAVEEMLRHRPGLVLVTGPTGSGKTTTVYAMLQTLGPGNQNIVSIEDPVEYRVPGIRQLSVNTRHDLTMARGLRTLLRMDPDVVFIGEIRDVEALDIAMRASSSGRYVFSTLHTRDVASTITALRDLHADNYSLAGNLTGIVSQRLIRCLCQKCRVAVPITGEEREVFLAEDLEPPTQLFQPRGCNVCQNSGYYDRVGVFEAVVANDKIAAAIQSGASEDELQRVIRATHFRSLKYDALTKVRDGLTSLDEASGLNWM